MMARLKIFLLLSFAIVFAKSAAQSRDSQTSTIADHINRTSRNMVVQPDELNQLLLPDENAAKEIEGNANSSKANMGFRIQIFSDNNARTAKNEARLKERNIKSRLPQYRTYVTYHSPYWRLRVGDFKSQEEANNAAAEIKRVFPQYAKEVRVVPDKINLVN